MSRFKPLEDTAKRGLRAMERELLLLRKLVESVLPSCYRLEEVDVTIGSLWPGQEPSFKAVIHVVQVAEDAPDTCQPLRRKRGPLAWLGEHSRQRLPSFKPSKK